ncbi:hypothetical protein LCGC14_0103030 [marine sediment metagenome]|uniref:Dockerin domain-containing protein n=1 Tax=marine sediment metagenome TaxID=412755 RepID=A0A0F9VSG8_9ZZZZ|nr:hypothetical protein [Candidatus Nealsonbacteria bacterium]
MKPFINYFLSLIIILIFLGVTSFFHIHAAEETVTISATVEDCGNDVKGGDEQCDGSDLNGETCVSRGFTGGTLSCNDNCTFNTFGCSSGGGGGGGAYIPPPPQTAVNFSGRAYPLSKVTVLKDGQVAITTIAGPDANFYISLSGLSSGNYIFSVYGEDNKQRRSSLFTFPVFVTRGAITTISGIFLAPTIDVDKSEVKRGDNIAIFGQSAPQGEITISINSEEEIFVKTNTDADGIYLYNFDTSPLAIRQHLTKSKVAADGIISSFSKTVTFNVGTKTVFKEKPEFLKGDLNNDGRVNLVDFSIAAYWYKRSISAEFARKEAERLNNDGKIDLVDFSIMAFYWTG